MDPGEIYCSAWVNKMGGVHLCNLDNFLKTEIRFWYFYLKLISIAITQ